jgi:surface polysaccharide O-acyltransferase-like enzyme
MILNFLTKAGDNIKEGTAAMKDIAKALLLLTLDVYLLTGAALLMALVDWESLGKVVVMMVVLGLFVAGAMYIADKWDKGGANMQKAFLGVGALLLMGAAAIGLAVYIARENKIEDILLGIGMVALVIVGTYFMITKLLEKADKDYETALKNVAASIAIIAATALIANFLLAPLYEKAKEIAIGAVMVLAIIGVMVAIVKWLAKED